MFVEVYTVHVEVYTVHVEVYTVHVEVYRSACRGAVCCLWRVIKLPVEGNCVACGG